LISYLFKLESSKIKPTLWIKLLFLTFNIYFLGRYWHFTLFLHILNNIIHYLKMNIHITPAFRQAGYK
jgi:hypothetical protein